MGRLLAGAVVCTVACALWGAAAANAAARAGEPAGPRIAFAEWQVVKPAESSRFLLATIGPGGEERQPLLAGDVRPMPGAGLSWSPDGSELAFAGTRGKSGSSKERKAIYVIAAAGGAPRLVAGTANGSHPVWSPDGNQIAFSRFRQRSDIDPKKFHFSLYLSTTTWIVAASGGKPRRLTAWGNGKFAEPSSFSPDGRLALTRERVHSGPEAVLLDPSSGQTALIAREAEDPVFSPDGSRVALISFRDHIVVEGIEDQTAVGELYLVDPSGGHPRRLTHTPDRQEEAPSWDPSGTRIAFIQGTVQWAVGLTGVVEAVNADGSCPTLVAGKPKQEGRYGPPLDGPGLFTPAWQPGFDRGAAPLTC